MTEVVPFESLPGVNLLARGLATGAPDVSSFLPDRPDLPTVVRRVGEVLARFRPRATPQDDPVLADLASGRRAAVVAGQQVGLFTGPVLTVVKALAAAKLAEELAARGAAASPVFWCASEDHDLVEVTRVLLPADGGAREAGPDPTPLLSNRRPVGELPISVDVEALLAGVVEGLGQPPDPEVLEVLRALHTGRSFREGFVGSMRWLLDDGRIGFLDAARRADKPDLVPLAARLVRERAEVRRLLSARAAALEKDGHALQVTADPAALPLFAIVDGERLLLREAGSRLELKGGPEGAAFDPEEVVARFESGTWLPSFSALTRPLAASALLPVAATILGPAEIAYWAQAYPLFSWASLVPPVLVPRPMAALVEPPVRRLLLKLELSLGDVLGGEEALLNARGARAARGLVERIEKLRTSAREGLETLGPELCEVDPTLARALETTRGKVEFAFEKLAERAAGAAGRADETLARQVERLVSAVAPGGQLAERRYTPLTYLLRWGRRGLVEPLREGLRWDVSGLQRIDL